MLDLSFIMNSFYIRDLKFVEINEVGLIHHTYVVENFDKKYIVQELNPQIFNNLNILENNYSKIKRLFDNNSETNLIPIELLKCYSGSYHLLKDNKIYRVANFIDHEILIKNNIDEKNLFEIAKSLGDFQSIINDSEITLESALPNFINFNSRIFEFQKSLKIGLVDRIEMAKNEIDFLIKNAEIVARWNQFTVQFQIKNMHGDPKWTNFLFNKNKEVISIIDWDTMMPGYIHYDYGDLVRSCVTLSHEDDLIVDFNKNRFLSILNGYKSSKMYSRLNQDEKSYLVECPLPIIYIQAMRFLTDFIVGDKYYKTKNKVDNLRKAKSQISLFSQMQIFLKRDFNITTEPF